jgi:hypothetical protein
MKRIVTLTRFLLQDLFRSLTAIVPLAASLAFGIIAFEYGMDQAQLVTVGGVGIGTICILTTLLLAARANRAAMYPIVARLRERHELLAALVVASLILTAFMALLILGANLLLDRLTLQFPSLLWILPTWAALWLLVASLGLLLSVLVSRSGSHLLGYVLLAGLLVANDRKAWLASRGFDWLGKAVGVILWPASTLLSQGSAGIHERTYFTALIMTLAVAALFYLLAAWLFEQKDLLWTE